MKNYYCVKSDLNEFGDIYLHADEVDIEDSILVFYQNSKEIDSFDGETFEYDKRIKIMAFPLGKWDCFYLANPNDNTPEFVERWDSEFEPFEAEETPEPVYHQTSP